MFTVYASVICINPLFPILFRSVFSFRLKNLTFKLVKTCNIFIIDKLKVYSCRDSNKVTLIVNTDLACCVKLVMVS